MTDSSALVIGMISVASATREQLVDLLTDAGVTVEFLLAPDEIAPHHVESGDIDLWMLDLGDDDWSDQLDELLEKSQVPIFFNDHQAINQQSHLDFWVRNLIERMAELVGADVPHEAATLLPEDSQPLQGGASQQDSHDLHDEQANDLFAPELALDSPDSDASEPSQPQSDKAPRHVEPEVLSIDAAGVMLDEPHDPPISDPELELEAFVEPIEELVHPSDLNRVDGDHQDSFEEPLLTDDISTDFELENESGVLAEPVSPADTPASDTQSSDEPSQQFDFDMGDLSVSSSEYDGLDDFSVSAAERASEQDEALPELDFALESEDPADPNPAEAFKADEPVGLLDAPDQQDWDSATAEEHLASGSHPQRSMTEGSFDALKTSESPANKSADLPQDETQQEEPGLSPRGSGASTSQLNFAQQNAELLAAAEHLEKDDTGAPLAELQQPPESDTLVSEMDAELSIPMLDEPVVGMQFEESVLTAPIWVLGASLGGPAAVKRFLNKLPPDLGVTFILVQHIDSNFVPVLAKILEAACHLDTRIVTGNQLLSSNQLLLAPVEQRLDFSQKGVVGLQQSSWTPPYSPCVDDVLKDAAERFGQQANAIIFSGMGNDGSLGAEAVKAAGGQVWVQQPESCANSSMPESVLAAVDSDYVGTPEELAETLAEYIHQQQTEQLSESA